MSDSVLLRKAQTIERCLRRIEEVYASDHANLYSDMTKQDSILLNLERACQAAIDAGNRIIRLRGLGLPRESKDVFAILKSNEVISEELAQTLVAMVGFRNVAVHDYQVLKLEIVRSIIEEKLSDLHELAQIAVRFS